MSVMNSSLPLNEFPEPFVASFRDQIGFTADELAFFCGFFHKQYLAPKQHYLREGDISRQKSYIVQGCTRTYTLNDKGKEHTQFFAFEDWWIADFESYHTQKPSNSWVQAIEACEVLTISRDSWLEAEQKIPKMQQWYLRKAQRMYIATLKRLNEIKTCSPEERYQLLLARHPDIFQRVPLQYIATYLDIEPPSLSRLRKRMMVKGQRGGFLNRG